MIDRKAPQTLTKSGTGQWQTARLVIDDALFADRDHEADFRIDDRGDGAEIVRAVTVRLLSPGAAAASEVACGNSP